MGDGNMIIGGIEKETMVIGCLRR